MNDILGPRSRTWRNSELSSAEVCIRENADDSECISPSTVVGTELARASTIGSQ